MNSFKEWFTAKELEGVRGLPSLATNITRKAKIEKWKTREAKGIKGGGNEYHIKSLPLETQLHLKSDLSSYSIEAYSEKEPSNVKLKSLTIADSDEFELIDDFSGIIEVSAGFGGFNEDSDTQNQTKIERSWLISRGLKAKDCSLFSVDGNSMEPTLSDGDRIVVDRSKTYFKEGKIYVINHRGSLWVKKVRKNYNSIDLISDNPDSPPITLDADEADELIVIGQVVRAYRDF